MYFIIQQRTIGVILSSQAVRFHKACLCAHVREFIYWQRKTGEQSVLKSVCVRVVNSCIPFEK